MLDYTDATAAQLADRQALEQLRIVRAESLMRLSQRVHGFTTFELAALHDLVAISGSLMVDSLHIRIAPE